MGKRAELSSSIIKSDEWTGHIPLTRSGDDTVLYRLYAVAGPSIKKVIAKTT